MYVDPSGEFVGVILALVTLAGFLVVTLSGCSSDTEVDKSITEDDINMYEDDKGSPVEGKLNVKFSPNGDNPSFQIENSYQITDEDQQRQILEYIVESEYYSYDTYGRTVDSMLIEWAAHNEIYGYVRHDRVRHTDFDRNSEGWQREDYWDYFWSEVYKELTH